jgi:DNA-binding IclR family transcriptional regulator
MACVNDTTTLTSSAEKLLIVAEAPATPAELAQRAKLPLFRVRSTLRQLVTQGLLVLKDGHYHLTEAGRARLTQ